LMTLVAIGPLNRIMLFPVSRQAEEVSGQLDQSRVKRLRPPRSHLAISPHGVTDTLHFLTKWSAGWRRQQIEAPKSYAVAEGS
ncbi:MAG TPA: hypothetical protein VNZ53_45095, partial [Steroidobacteraceae bacterium]|nr:hypothetical protein [Steroidobacteraceae bacterium]